MSDSARGCSRHPELVELSDILAEQTQAYLNNGGTIEENPLVTHTVADIKAKGLIDVSKIMKQKKRPGM